MTELKRYLLLPGFVASRSDGERHYLDAPELARLYGVPLRECDVHYPGMPAPSEDELSRMIWLFPRTDEDYSLPDPGVDGALSAGCPIQEGEPDLVRWGVIAGGVLLVLLVVGIAWVLLAFA